MQKVLHAHLSSPIPQPELSKMWESERTTFTTGTGDGIETWLTAPELVIESHECDVDLRFPDGQSDNVQEKLKHAFERALARYRPEVDVEWEN